MPKENKADLRLLTRPELLAYARQLELDLEAKETHKDYKQYCKDLKKNESR